MVFREDKATQMAARFLQLAERPIPYLHLMKMLYLADKQMLLRWGKPITYDRWVAMKYGPVLSGTYDLVKSARGDGDRTYWSQHLRTVGYDVEVTDDPGSDALSPAEERVINEVFGEHGGLDRWDLVRLTHDLPEWEDPGGSSREIAYQTVLQVEGLPEDAIRDILDNIDAQGVFERVTGKL